MFVVETAPLFTVLLVYLYPVLEGFELGIEKENILLRFECFFTLVEAKWFLRFFLFA